MVWVGLVTAEMVDCPACVGWGKFHLARCIINPGGRQYAHTVQSDATERSATVDGSHEDGPGSDAAPEDRRQDHPTETEPAASAYRWCGASIDTHCGHLDCATPAEWDQASAAVRVVCTCRLTIHNWRSGHGTVTTVRDTNCARHGEDAA